LQACIQAVEVARACLTQTSELIIVNNGGGEAVAEVAEVNPTARHIELLANAGYPTAVMCAIEATDAPWIATINDDIRLEPDSLQRLLDEGSKDPAIGAVGAQVRFAGRPSILNSAGIDVDRLGIAFDRDLGSPAAASERRPTRVFGVSGAAAVYRRRMILDVG